MAVFNFVELDAVAAALSPPPTSRFIRSSMLMARVEAGVDCISFLSSSFIRGTFVADAGDFSMSFWSGLLLRVLFLSYG